MSNTMPREGPSIMIMLLAGIGMDQLLKVARARRGLSSTLTTDPNVLILPIAIVLLGLLALAFSLAVLGASSAGLPVRNALAHMAIYLALSSGLCLVLLFAPARRSSYIAAALLIIVFMDLVVSASAYWKRGMVWYKNDGVHRYPSSGSIPPITSTSQSWPGSYRGLHSQFVGRSLLRGQDLARARASAGMAAGSRQLGFGVADDEELSELSVFYQWGVYSFRHHCQNRYDAGAGSLAMV